MAEKSAALSVRVKPEIKEALNALAKAEKRTLAAYVALLVEQHVEATQSAKRK